MPDREFWVPRLATIAGTVSEAAAVIRAFDETTFSSQQHIACISAPTGREEARGLWLAAQLHTAGYRTRQDNAGNVIARLPGDRPVAERHAEVAPVVCMAHLDTVFGDDTPLEPVQNGSRTSCPGIGDNGRGLAALLALARVFVRLAPSARLQRRAIEFVASVGEEGLGNLRGARAYFANRDAAGQPPPHAVVVLDGPGDQHIVHHALGSRRYRVSFRGSGGHSWTDFGAPNAVHAAARAAAMLSELPRSSQRRIALTVSGIGGGESVNSIPAAAYIEIDLRGTDAAGIASADSELRRVVLAAVQQECDNAARMGNLRATRTAARSDSVLESQVVLVGERPCGSLSLHHPLVQLAREATCALDIEPVSAIASTDANIPLSLGIPAITIGGGGTGGGAHTMHEWYDNTDGARGIARAFAVLAALVA